MMTKINIMIFSLLTISIFAKLDRVIGIECCGNINCSVRKKCADDHSHCMLTGKLRTNESSRKSIDLNHLNITHIDCWLWQHEANLCPRGNHSCLSVHSSANFYTFCCAGDFCNDPRTMRCELSSGKANITTLNFEKRNNIHSTNLPGNKPNFLMIFIIIGVCFIVILIGVILLRSKWVRLTGFINRKFTKRETTYNGLSQISDRATCITKVTSDNFSMNQQHAFGEEVLKASKYFEKCEKKCLGKFGEIWSGKSIGSDDQTVAIKIFRPRDESSWETELDMYRFVRNRVETVLKYIGCDKILKYNETEELWLVTQYIERGSLHDYLNDPVNVRPKWSQVLTVCLDIAGGLSYLHEDGSYQIAPHISGKPSIAHRDLKSRNILIKADWRACIADLGLAVSFQGNRSLSDLHLQVGTQRYMAPEVLEGAINFSRDSFLGIDVYAMALIMWEVFSQCVDFEDLAENNSNEIPVYMQPFQKELGLQITMENLQSWVVNDNRRPQFPDQYSGFSDGQSLWRTITECWDRDAEARLSSSCVFERLSSLYQKYNNFIVSMSVNKKGARVIEDSTPLI